MKFKKIISFIALSIFLLTMTACSAAPNNSGSESGESITSTIPESTASITPESSDSGFFESAEGKQIKLITDNTEVTVTLNGSRAAADLVKMLPLELTLIERNEFAKGFTLPEHLSSEEPTTREYQIGDFGYWNAGPDLAIFYDDIYEQTIVSVIPLGHADNGAETLRNEVGSIRLELITE